MDPKNERLDANDPLRLLFQEIGHQAAPVDLENKIFQKLASTSSVQVSYAPLISKQLWYGIGIMLALVVMVSATFLSVGSTSISWLSTIMQWLNIPKLSSYLMSPWVLAAAGGAIVLTLMDQLITSRMRTMHAL